MSRNDSFKMWPSWALAHLLLRLWVGTRLLMAGLDKFRVSGSKGVTSEFNLEAYAINMGKIVDGIFQFGFLGKYTPDWAINFYRQYLGWAMVVVGGLIIIGLFRRFSIFMGGILFLSLTVGLLSLPEDLDGVMLGIQMGLCAFALITVKHDVFSLGFLLYGWWRKRPETDDEEDAVDAAA